MINSEKMPIGVEIQKKHIRFFCQQLFNPRYFWGQLEVRRVYLKYSSLAEYIDSVRADTNLSIQAARITPPIGPAADR